MRINFKHYLLYKTLNSLFAGIAMGAIFIIYGGLDPIIFSYGGIVLAVGVWGVAHLYQKILTTRHFFFISLIVEALTLVTPVLILIFSHSYIRSLSYYVVYQMIFIFGQYLMRAETLLLKKKMILKLADIRKQQGYIAGLILSALFYTIIKRLGTVSPLESAEMAHKLLFTIQLFVVYSLIRSFIKEEHDDVSRKN